jgi:hydrogenase nickel incorporation protein HypA/HybF
VPESLAYYFEILARGTPCEGAEFEQRLAPARMSCECGEEWELDEPSFRCPRCGGAETRVLDGDQLSVDSIEVQDEQEEAGCTAQR